MAKKRFYDEHGNEIRSRPSEPFYKKWGFWMLGVLLLIFGTIGIHALVSESEIADERIEQGAEEERAQVEEAGTEDDHAKPEEIVEEQTYTYEDFKGIYVSFIGEPYNSPIGMSDIIVLGDDFFQSFNRWDFDMTSTILDKTVEGNVLTLDLDSDKDEQWGFHSQSGTEQFELSYIDDKKILNLITNDESLYSMSNHDLQNNYNQLEIDYARIIMTLRGVPSLDSWAAYSSEYDGDKPVIGVTHDNEGDPIPYIDDDAEVGYPEDVTTLYLQNKTRQDEISYTYASIEDGYIRVYPVPLNHAIRTGQEVIEEAEKKYIKPFEPYEVADFIGNVEFDKE